MRVPYEAGQISGLLRASRFFPGRLALRNARKDSQRFSISGELL
jgi:hypothetical protein